MADEDRRRWDNRHACRPSQRGPAAFLEQIFLSFPREVRVGKALDIATGKGRNALFLAEKGFSVEAIDISKVAVEEARRKAEERNLSILFRQADLDHYALAEAAYDLILNFDFLQRTLIPAIQKALKPGGHIIFETYLIDEQVFGRHKNPAYLLGHNELLDLFRDLRILYYREGKFVEEGRDAYRAGLFGQRVG